MIKISGKSGQSAKKRMPCFFKRATERYKGAPSPYTQTLCVSRKEPTKVKYATQTASPPPSHKNTITKGIKRALKRTGKSPPIKIFKVVFFNFAPTRYVTNAASRVVIEPNVTS